MSGYRITATRQGSNEGVGSAATLGESHGRVYESEAEAQADADYLAECWQDDWGLGPCPTYKVEAV